MICSSVTNSSGAPLPVLDTTITTRIMPTPLNPRLILFGFSSKTSCLSLLRSDPVPHRRIRQTLNPTEIQMPLTVTGALLTQSDPLPSSTIPLLFSICAHLLDMRQFCPFSSSSNLFTTQASQPIVGDANRTISDNLNFLNLLFGLTVPSSICRPVR